MITFRDTDKMKINIAMSFMEIAKKKNYNKISISEIMKPLNVSRQNFYYYYADINELIDWINTCNLDVPFQNFKEDKSLRTAYVGSLTNLFENRSFLRNVLSFVGDGPFEKSLYDNMMEAILDHIGRKRFTEDIKFSSHLYLKGVIAVMVEYIEKDIKSNPEELADLFVKALPQNMVRFYEYDKYDVEVKGKKRF